MTIYSLDVVFNSATVPVKPDGRIYAMGFGFAESPSGIWKEDGQQVERVRAGAEFYFSVFDSAPETQAAVTAVEVTFFDPDNPAVIWPYSPLSDPMTASETLPNPIVAQVELNSRLGLQNSPGCNVADAAVWRIGPYIVTLPDNIPQLILDCTVLIHVLVDPNDASTTKTFSVDPEIQVDGGG